MACSTEQLHELALPCDAPVVDVGGRLNRETEGFFFLNEH